MMRNHTDSRRIVALLIVVSLFCVIPAAFAEESIPSTSNLVVREMLKPVSYWNEHPMANLPNPFELINGKIVETADEWNERAAEIKEMIQYYEYGYKPAPADAITYELGVQQYKAFDWSTWTLVDKEIDGMAIELTVGENKAVMNVGVQLPETPAPAAGYPAVICLGGLAGSNAADFLPRGYAVIGLDVSQIYNEQTSEGIVKTLFNFDWLADPNAPSSMMGWAWGVSSLIDALELGAYKGIINPEQLVVTGFSRNGKGALVAGAFDERIAVVAPGNAGCGGTAIERFVCPLNYPEYYIYSTPDDPSDAFVVLPAQENLKNVRKWTLSEGSKDAWNEEEQRYVPRYQTLSHCREQQDIWFCNRFQQFMQDESVICDPVDINKWTDQVEGVNPYEWEDGYDGPGYGGKGSPFGVLYSLPLDQHFLMSLVAPRGLMIHSGYVDDWNNPEGMAFGYYVTRETYRYLDVLNGTDGEYANRINLVMGDWGHAYPASAANALIDFCNTIIQPEGEIYAQKAVYTGYPYPDDDERRLSDYDKLNWSALKPEVAVIEISLADEAKLAVGETVLLKAVVTPDNATGINAVGLVWTVDNESVVTVDETGLVTAFAAGTAEVTVSFGGISAACVVTVS